MPRFFKEFFENEPFIEGDDAKHIAKSLRMRVGEALTVCDTKGNDYNCTISAVLDGRIELEVNNVVKTVSEPGVEVTLFQCLTKGDKMDLIVRQAVEMGVSKVVPTVSQNCVSRPDEKQLNKKIERWQRIADEAAGQSGRGILPKVLDSMTLTDVAKTLSSFDRCYFFYELGGESVGKIEPDVKKIAVIIGPEGGFSLAEAERFKTAGATVSTLGPRILRAETAPVAAVSLIMHSSNNM